MTNYESHDGPPPIRYRKRELLMIALREMKVGEWMEITDYKNDHYGQNAANRLVSRYRKEGMDWSVRLGKNNKLVVIRTK